MGGRSGIASRFPARLRRAMSRRRVSQAQLARDSGITPPCMSRYVSGVRVPTLDNLERIKKALGCGWDELLG